MAPLADSMNTIGKDQPQDEAVEADEADEADKTNERAMSSSRRSRTPLPPESVCQPNL